MSLLQMSFFGAVFIIAVVIIRAFTINKLPKKTFLVLWDIVLLRLLIPFSIPSILSIYSFIGENTHINTFHGLIGNPIIPAIQGKPFEVTGKFSQEYANGLTSFSMWSVIWLIGVIICMAFFVITYLHCHFEFHASLPVENDFVKQWLMEHQLRRTIYIRQSDRIFSPLTYGIFNPVILMPKKTDWKNTNLLHYVLSHEYVHICRFDTFKKLIITLVLCIHWFNPMVWVMYVLFNRDIELTCDERVVRQFGETSKSAYALVLISMEENKSGLMPFCSSFNKNVMEERITAIMKIKKASAFAILIAAGLIICTTTAFATNRIQNAEVPVKTFNESASQYESVSIQQLSLHPGSHEEYGRYSFKKGDIITVDISWNEPGNVYFAIGSEFGHFRGLQTSGDSTSFNTAIKVKEDGEYYIYLGIQGTEYKGVDEIVGEISYPVN